MAFGDFKGVPFLDQTSLPDPQSVPLDPNTEALIQKKYEQAMQDPRELQNQHNAQVEEAANSTYKGYLGNDAIKQKYGRLLTQELGDIKNKASEDLRSQHRNKLKMAQQAVIARQQVINDAFARQMEAYNQREAARSQAIGSIIGAGMMIGGYALAGPAGGMAAGAMSGAGRGGTGYSSSPGAQQRSYLGVDTNIGADRGYNQSMSYLNNIQGIGER